MLKKLTTRIVREKMKQGWRAAEFCAKYGCTTSELEARIRCIFNKKCAADDVLREMRKDTKKSKRAPLATTVAPTTVDMAAVNEAFEKSFGNSGRRYDVVAISEHKEPTTDAPSTINEAVQEQRESFEERLHALEERESELSELVCNSEVAWFEAKSRRTNHLRELQEIGQEFKLLADQCLALIDRRRRTVQQINAAAEQMNAASSARKELGAELDKIRAQIQEMAKVIIGVTADGDFLVFDDEFEVELDASGSEQIFKAILENEVCAELKVREIRTVARLLAIRQNMPMEIEAVFDNPDVEAVFDLLSEAEETEAESGPEPEQITAPAV